MSSPEERPPGEERRTRAVGAGIAIGIGVGTAISVATQNPVWTAIGIPLGAAFGQVIGGRR